MKKWEELRDSDTYRGGLIDTAVDVACIVGATAVMFVPLVVSAVARGDITWSDVAKAVRDTLLARDT